MNAHQFPPAPFNRRPRYDSTLCSRRTIYDTADKRVRLVGSRLTVGPRTPATWYAIAGPGDGSFPQLLARSSSRRVAAAAAVAHLTQGGRR